MCPTNPPYCLRTRAKDLVAYVSVVQTDDEFGTVRRFYYLPSSRYRLTLSRSAERVDAIVPLRSFFFETCKCVRLLSYLSIIIIKKKMFSTVPLLCFNEIVVIRTYEQIRIEIINKTTGVNILLLLLFKRTSTKYNQPLVVAVFLRQIFTKENYNENNDVYMGNGSTNVVLQ